MTTAYDRIYLEKARVALGRMLDYAVYDLKYDLADFWELFLASSVSEQFQYGNVSVLVGRSGVELALIVSGKDKDYRKPFFSEARSKEYWLGWALAYYQWETCISFSQITEFVSMNELRRMYSPYHEMDIRQFCDKVTKMITERKTQTNLKQKRIMAGLTQLQLAKLSGVPLRTLQQYEQGQKDINKARADYVFALSRALFCNPQQLLEIRMPEHLE